MKQLFLYTLALAMTGCAGYNPDTDQDPARVAAIQQELLMFPEYMFHPDEALLLLQHMRSNDGMGPGISGYAQGMTDLNFWVSEAEEAYVGQFGVEEVPHPDGTGTTIIVDISALARAECTRAIVEQFGGTWDPDDPTPLPTAESQIPAGQINSNLQQLETEIVAYALLF